MLLQALEGSVTQSIFAMERSDQLATEAYIKYHTLFKKIAQISYWRIVKIFSQSVL